MQNAWERREMHNNLLQENLKERTYLEDLGINYFMELSPS
jgi:hypothetical protein